MRILFLQKRPLLPANTGGKIRTLNVLRHLSQWHEITYLCNMDEGENSSVEEMRRIGLRVEALPWNETPRGSARFYGQLALNLLSRYPFNVVKDYDRNLRQRARILVESQRFDLLICDFVQMARNAIGLADVPTILFQHNVEAEIFERNARVSSNWLHQAYFAYQSRKMHWFEGRAGRGFDAVIAVSRRDAEIFQQRYGWGHVHVIDTAVDLAHFRPAKQCETPNRVAFVGSLDWPPNVSGLQWFVRRVWPLIRARNLQATFQIVGRNPEASVIQLGEVEGVEVVGSVADVRPYLAEAAVVAVPLLSGSGTRLKIFEAMAMQKAVVSTTIGAEGLGVSDREHLLLSDDARSFAAAILELFDAPQHRRELADRGRQLVATSYGAERIARQFESVCKLVATNKVTQHAGGKGIAPAFEGRQQREKLVK